jgi:MFS family permease
MILGSVAAPAAARRWRRERLFGVAIGVVGIAVILASQANVLSPVLLLWIFAGAGNGIGSVSYGSLLQERTPNRLRGRVMAASEAVLDGAFLLGAASAGWLGSHVGVRGSFIVSGVIFLLAAVLSQRLLLDRSDEPAEELAAYPVAALLPMNGHAQGKVVANGQARNGAAPNGHAREGVSVAGRLLDLERLLSEDAGMPVRIRRALKEVSLAYESEEDLDRIIARLRRDG